MGACVERMGRKSGGENKDTEGETTLEHDNNHRTGASHAITIITSNDNTSNFNSNDNDNNDTSNSDTNTTYNDNNGNGMPAGGTAPAAWTVTGRFQVYQHDKILWGRLARRTTK